METNLDQVLERLNSDQLFNPEQEFKELSSIFLESFLTDPQISYCCAKLFNSEISLLKLLKKSPQSKDRQVASLKKKTCEFIKDLLKQKTHYVVEYLNVIYVNFILPIGNLLQHLYH